MLCDLEQVIDLSFKPLETHRLKLWESRLAQMNYRPAIMKSCWGDIKQPSVTSQLWLSDTRLIAANQFRNNKNWKLELAI